ncbi:MAG: HD domain-containing phosphohydrolase [Acidimicrobiia bacterium]
MRQSEATIEPVWQRLGPPVLGATMAALALPYTSSPMLYIVFGIFGLAAGAQLGVPSANGRRFGLPVAIGAAAPIFLIEGSQIDVPSVLVVYGAGMAIGGLVFSIRPTSKADSSVLRSLIGMTIYALVFNLIRRAEVVQSIEQGWRILIPLVIAAIVWLLVDTLIWILVEEQGDLRWHTLGAGLTGDANVFVSLVATGALFGLSYRTLSWLALGVAGLPFIFAHSAFARFQQIKRTYRQTIRALARIPEVAGLGEEGHADRTANLALAVGHEMGLTRSNIDELEYAALMHDIGRITLTEPAIIRVGYTDDDIARWGAEIISQAPYLERIADHVRRLHEPYRKPGEQSDPAISTISKIVRATSVYDHLVVERELSALQAIEVLHQGAAYDFDPRIVASMRRVLERRGAFHPGSIHPGSSHSGSSHSGSGARPVSTHPTSAKKHS